MTERDKATVASRALQALRNDLTDARDAAPYLGDEWQRKQNLCAAINTIIAGPNEVLAQLYDKMVNP